MFAARFLPFTVSGVRLLTRPVPRGAGAVLGRASPSTPATSGPTRWQRSCTGCSSAGSRRRRASGARSPAPALVVGHPARPDPPGRRRRDARRGDAQRHVRAGPQHPRVAGPPGPAQPRGGRLRARVLANAAPPSAYQRLTRRRAEWAGASLSRRGDRAAHPQAGRGRPHHHPADPQPRAGARGRQGRTPDHARGGAHGWSRSPTSTCSWPRAATSTRSPRPRR